ncbi:hypothetical protein HDK77DRAFT_595 [Phyllosticta capitalensis]
MAAWVGRCSKLTRSVVWLTVGGSSPFECCGASHSYTALVGANLAPTKRISDPDNVGTRSDMKNQNKHAENLIRLMPFCLLSQCQTTS